MNIQTFSSEFFFSQRITFDKIWESRAEHLLQNNYDNNSYSKSEFLRIQNFSEFFHVHTQRLRKL